MAITIHESQLTELLTDPVMAAKVIMNYDLDPFQAAALRMDWWHRFTIDSSGQATGKTARVFILTNLRCILIPDQWAAVYFQNTTTAHGEFWPYFAATMQRSDIFRDQFKLHHNKVGEHKPSGNWYMEYRSGSRLELPSPGHTTDARSQASRSFNTIVVDECWQAIAMGAGVEDQIMGRARRPAWHRTHPIWGNHLHLKGHAQSPSHEGYKFVQSYRNFIRDGSTSHGLYSFCYKDFQKGSPIAAKVVPHEVIATTRATSPEKYRRQWLGLWARGGSTFYPETLIYKARRADVAPETQRAGECHYILGFDTAPGMSVKSDYSAAVVLRLREITPQEHARLAGAGVKAGIFAHGGRLWEACYVFAHRLKAMTAGEIAGFIHMLHIRFGFSGIVLDPGGGGLFVYPELKKSTAQIASGQTVRVVPLCTRHEPLWHDKQPIVHIFKRGTNGDGDFDTLPHVGPNFLRGDDGFLAAHHLQFRLRWESSDLAVPMPLDERDARSCAEWTPEMRSAQLALDMAGKELARVNQKTNDTGQPMVSSRGYPLFGSPGKKDLAYSMLYAASGMELLLESLAMQEEGEDGDMVFSSAR